jgi:hypothetical protein
MIIDIQMLIYIVRILHGNGLNYEGGINMTSAYPLFNNSAFILIFPTYTTARILHIYRSSSVLSFKYIKKDITAMDVKKRVITGNSIRITMDWMMKRLEIILVRQREL